MAIKIALVTSMEADASSGSLRKHLDKQGILRSGLPESKAGDEAAALSYKELPSQQ